MKKILSFITIALLALTCTACGAKNDPSGISKDEFDQINMGMTIFKVEEIVGTRKIIYCVCAIFFKSYLRAGKDNRFCKILKHICKSRT